MNQILSRANLERVKAHTNLYRFDVYYLKITLYIDDFNIIELDVPRIF